MISLSSHLCGFIVILKNCSEMTDKCAAQFNANVTTKCEKCVSVYAISINSKTVDRTQPKTKKIGKQFSLFYFKSSIFILSETTYASINMCEQQHNFRFLFIRSYRFMTHMKSSKFKVFSCKVKLRLVILSIDGLNLFSATLQNPNKSLMA